MSPSTRHRRRVLTTGVTTLVAATLALGACTSDGDWEGTSTPDGDRPITNEIVAGSFGTLDDIVASVMESTGVPGVAVAVVYDDQVVHEQGYGVRNTESREPVTAETVFQLASMSKPISSTVMAGLVGEEAFAWDDPVAQYTPQFRLADDWVAEHVTFADLFSHRSGLPGGAAGNDLESIGFDRDTILSRLVEVPLDPFRITYSYSNFGMTLAGEAAAEAAGETWEEASTRVLFDPAGMTSTSMRHADYLDRENRADLHVQLDGRWSPSFDRQPDAQAPAGGVSSNVVDLARWMRLQLAEGSLDGDEIIDTDALDQTHLPQIMKNPPQPTMGDAAGFYGLGWAIGTDHTGRVRWDHSGAFSLGASTAVKLIPSQDVGIVVLTNGAPVGAPEAIADAYLSALQTGDPDLAANLELWTSRFANLYGEPAEDWDSPPGDATAARSSEAYVGSYTNEYVGTAQVVAVDGGLELLLGPEPMRFALEHWDGDTFSILDAPELPAYRSPVTFAFEAGASTAGSVNVASLDGAELGTLRRT